MTVRIHPTAIIETGVEIGDGSAIWDNVHVRGPSRIGRNCIVGEKSYIAYGVEIGDLVKINAYVYICNAVTIERGVMIAAGTVFTNDVYPRATDPDFEGLRSSAPDEDTKPTLVREGATIGARAVIGSDLAVGRFAMVGMGAVVTRSVPDFNLVVGHPARTIGYVCRCGHPTWRSEPSRTPPPSEVSCSHCDRRYEVRDGEVRELQVSNASRSQGAGAAAMTMAPQRWCVVGGGMLGSTLALKLAHQGHAVTLLESSDRLGGLADAWQVGDLTWDRHYHVILLSDLHLRGLLGELGLQDELRWTTTKTEFYARGRFHPLTNAIDYLRLPVIGLIDKVRLAGTIIYAAQIADGRSLEKISVETWLTRLSGRRTWQAVWQPLLRAKLGDNWRHASAAFIWAIIRRLYAARRTGLKTEMFGYVAGGYARIIERLTSRLGEAGVSVETRAEVDSIRQSADGIVVRTHGSDRSFDRVVVTTPARLASRLCPGLNASEHEALKGILYQGIICASVVLARPLNGAYITYITDPKVPFTAVIEMSSLVDRSSELGGRSLVYLPWYVPADDDAFRMTDADIESRFLDGLVAMYSGLTREDIVAFRVSRVREVLAVATIDYSSRLPPMATSIDGLYVVNSAHIVNGTLNVNETVKLATDAMAVLTTALTEPDQPRPEPSIAPPAHHVDVTHARF